MSTILDVRDLNVRFRQDGAVTHAVNEAFPDCRVLVDANDAYTVDEATKYITAVADCNLYWIEEAFHEDGRLYGFVNVFVGEAECRTLEGLATPLAADTVVSVVPAVAGG